jgi:enterochelin esterase-like enzyme
MKCLLVSLVLSLTLALSMPAQAQALPEVSVGRIERLADFPSRFVQARHVDVWLPEGYTPTKRYNVLYMHDGQMLFDASKTWNQQAWDAHLTVDRLVRAGRIPDTLIVGIWNKGPLRHSEYMPQKYLLAMPEAFRKRLIEGPLQGKPQSDAYLRFLVDELKPAIDARYATRPEAASTFVMGSSMGAMISVYAMNEYPAVFGGAAGLSTHWVGMHKPNAAIPLAAFNYLRDHLADPASHRLYQDHGTTELDALYAPYQLMVNELARERGYEDGKTFETRVFEGAGHNERAWAQRLEASIVFLMGQR